MIDPIKGGSCEASQRRRLFCAEGYGATALRFPQGFLVGSGENLIMFVENRGLQPCVALGNAAIGGRLPLFSV